MLTGSVSGGTNRAATGDAGERGVPTERRTSRCGRADDAWTSVTKPVEEPISQCRIHPEAQRIAERLDIHHIPKHGSWLNIAEIELSVLGRQYSDRRISDAARLLREVAS
jgi:hypothetical protein